MPLTVRIINPDRVMFEGPVELLLAPGKIATLGIMEGHTPMFAELIKGDLVIKGEKEEVIGIESGILKVKNDEVTILVTPVAA